MGEIVLQVLTPTFIVSALIAILVFLSRNLILARLKGSIKNDYAKQLTNYENNLELRTEIELAKLNSRLSLELELAKMKLKPYSEQQFILYNELWQSLCDLKFSMELLWARASEDYLMEFADRLATTSDKLEKSALLIEPQHYQELNEILNSFGEYHLGKQALKNIWQNRPTTNPINDAEIRHLIEINGDMRNRLRTYLPEIKECLRKQICGGQ